MSSAWPRRASVMSSAIKEVKSNGKDADPSQPNIGDLRIIDLL